MAFSSEEARSDATGEQRRDRAGNTTANWRGIKLAGRLTRAGEPSGSWHERGEDCPRSDGDFMQLAPRYVVHQDQTITAGSSAVPGVPRRAGPRPSQTAIRSTVCCLPKQVSGHYLPDSEVTRGSYKKGFFRFSFVIIHISLEESRLLNAVFAAGVASPLIHFAGNTDPEREAEPEGCWSGNRITKTRLPRWCRCQFIERELTDETGITTSGTIIS
jgi:hypothetical protein